MTSRLVLRVKARQLHEGRPLTAAEAFSEVRVVLRRLRPELVRAAAVEPGYKGSLTVTLHGQRWLGFDHRGELGPVNADLVPWPKTPPVGSAAFEAGCRRFDRAVVALAGLIRRRPLPHGCEGRQIHAAGRDARRARSAQAHADLTTQPARATPTSRGEPGRH